MNDVVTVVVPVRDFAKGLVRFLDGWREAFQNMGREAQFTFIHDGNADANPLGDNDIAILRNVPGSGLGECLRIALGTAESTVLIVVPDFGYRPSDLQALFNAFKDVDMVIGVRPGQGMPRWLAGVKRLATHLRRWLFGIPATDVMPWFGWHVARQRLRFRFVYGPKLQDPGTGLLLVRRLILDRCPIQSDGAFAILELIAKANFLGATIAEVKLAKPSDMPVMKGKFECIPSDEKQVFRHPTFLPAQNTTGTDDKSSIPVAVS